MPAGVQGLPEWLPEAPLFFQIVFATQPGNDTTNMTGTEWNPTTRNNEIRNKTMRYFVAVNGYRTSTSNGFGNTWQVMECDNKKHQMLVLSRGLTVRDVQGVDKDGNRTAVYSTNGIRVATAAEIREAKKQEEYGHPIQNVEPYREQTADECQADLSELHLG